MNNSFLALVRYALGACKRLVNRIDDSVGLCVSAKAPPNLPPGVPLMNPHLFMGQAAASGLPPFYVSYSQQRDNRL